MKKMSTYTVSNKTKYQLYCPKLYIIDFQDSHSQEHSQELQDRHSSPHTHDSQRTHSPQQRPCDTRTGSPAGGQFAAAEENVLSGSAISQLNPSLDNLLSAVEDLQVVDVPLTPEGFQATPGAAHHSFLEDLQPVPKDPHLIPVEHPLENLLSTLENLQLPPAEGHRLATEDDPHLQGAMATTTMPHVLLTQPTHHNNEPLEASPLPSQLFIPE